MTKNTFNDDLSAAEKLTNLIDHVIDTQSLFEVKREALERSTVWHVSNGDFYAGSIIQTGLYVSYKEAPEIQAGPLTPFFDYLIRRIEERIKAEMRPPSPAAEGVTQGGENQGSTYGPRDETLRKTAMVYKVKAAWKLSKTRACDCVDIKTTTFNRAAKRKTDIESELAWLDEVNFEKFLATFTIPERASIDDLYDRFMASLK